MSATTVDGTALLSLPGRILRPPVRVSILIVVIWHVVAALAFAWIAYNIFGAVWKLDSLPRTIIGIGASVGIVANLGAAVLLVRSNRRGRMASFTVNYLTLIFVIVLLFQSLDLASYLDDFAASFNQAFLPFIGLAIAVAWIVVARRLKARLTDSARADAPPALLTIATAMRWIGLAAVVLFGLAWLWLLKPLDLLRVLGDAFAADAAVNTAYVIAIVALLWCVITMWSARMADRFDASADALEAQSGWLFLSPNLIGFLLFFAGPLVFSLVISFYEWDGITSPTFVGFGNYIETLGISIASTADALPSGYEDILTAPFGVIGASDPLFWRSISNIVVFLVLAVPLAVIPALILAVLIQTGYRGTKAFRTIFFVPAVAGVIGVTLIWKQMLNSTVGFVNWFIGWVNGIINMFVPGDPMPQPVEIGWLSDPSVALFAVVLVFGWSQFGFNTVLFTAGMQGIPKELHEAAMLDGAGSVRRFFSITLPSLRATTFFVVASTVILALQLFDIVYALNQPNPVGFPDNATLTPVVYLYQLGFQQDAFGQASAVAWILFILIFSLTLVQFRRQRRYAEET
ncbi:MAG: sugar ABC transporter permease [Actinobacteria bacterium]|nr:sugar ABC transporter permease [Actinomycetota bacterium]